MALCKVCGNEFAWKKVTRGGGSVWVPHEPERDASGAIVYAQRPNGGGKFTRRAVPSANVHPCKMAPKAEGMKAGAEALGVPFVNAPVSPAYPNAHPEPHPVPDIDPEYHADISEQCCVGDLATGYVCTRIKGHKGEHVACLSGGKVLTRWPNPIIRPDPAPLVDPRNVATPLPVDLGAIVEAIKPAVRGQMIEVLDEYGVKPPARELVIAVGAVRTPVKGITHPMFHRIVEEFAARKHVYLAGPAGSGKTFGLQQAAEACGLRSAVCPMPGIQSAARIFGYEDANGVYRPTVFADYYENGGVFVADEFDGMMPAIAVAFNAPLENGWAVFGGRTVRMHADFVFAANGNTDGRGATIDYTARQPLDYASMARFAYINWGYHDGTEDAIVSSVEGVPGPIAAQVTAWVRKLRAEVKRQQVEKLLCGPRESLRIAEELARGTSFEDAVETWIRRGLADETWALLTRAAGPYPVVKVKA